MNTPQSNDGAQPEAGTTIKRLPLARSEFQIPKKTPSPPSDEGSKQKLSEPKGPSPNTRLLTNLRSFNVDRTKYKHYGSQSLMSTQTLEEIIKDSKSKPTTSKKDPISPASPTSSPPSPSTDLHKLQAGDLHRNLIDDSIADLLGLPSTSGGSVHWPYSSDTLSEIVRLKIEQEKTKQVTVKQELGSTIIELLKLARSMNINGDLIPLLFVNNTPDEVETYTHHSYPHIDTKANIEELKAKIRQLQDDPENLDHLITAKTMQETPRSSIKRKYSEGSHQLPSFDETAEKLRISVPAPSTGSVSPLRSPEKLPPPPTHRRIVSDNSETLRESRHLASSPSLQSVKGMEKSLANVSEPQSHPSQSSQHHLYPVYYTPINPKGVISQPPPPPPPPGSGSGSGGPQSDHSETHTASSTVLGSPYSQKYQPVIYHTPQTQFQPGYATLQQPPQYYFVPSPPPPQQQQGQQHPQYLVAPGSQPIPMGLVPGYPSGQQIQYQVSDMERGPVKYHQVIEPVHDPTPPTHASKKHKPTASKLSGINFMITTPKNPPAKKYNNTNRDKST